MSKYQSEMYSTELYDIFKDIKTISKQRSFVILCPFMSFLQDVKLAAMVASGGLRTKGGAVLDALFKSAMMMLERGCEKRPCSSKFFDSELGAELMFLLGRDKCMKQVLRRGVLNCFDLFAIASPCLSMSFHILQRNSPHSFD